MDSVSIHKDPNGKITFNGYEMHGLGTVLHEKVDKESKAHVIVVKFPAGKHFAGRGHSAYHSPSIYVLERDFGKDRYRVVANWDVKRPSAE